MSLIKLSPKAHLFWDFMVESHVPLMSDGSLSRELRDIRHIFMENWPAGLFRLSAEKVSLTDLSVTHAVILRFWQQFADGYLTALCHIPETTVNITVSDPEDAWLAGLILGAPPMTGGEYLSFPLLRQLWSRLDDWRSRIMRQTGNLSEFLKQYAPKWNQVGRVVFHLAENKNSETDPFAFLATYSSGFTVDGNLKYLPLHRALKAYSGKNHRQTLINLLTPVHRAAENVSWVKRMVRNNDIYRPKRWSPAEAYQFLSTTALLEESGIAVRVPDWWKQRRKTRVTVSIGNDSGEHRATRFDMGTLLDFDISMTAAGQRLTETEIQQLLDGEDGLVCVKGEWVEVDRERLREALDHWESVRRAAENGTVSFFEGMRLLAGADLDGGISNDTDNELFREWMEVLPGNELRKILEKLRNPDAMPGIDPSDTLRVTLRPYQQQGVSWLAFLTELGLGSCLADDMGLGKTIQVLTLLEHFRRRDDGGPPSLLVIPASLLGNWRDEAEKFTPALSLLFLHSAEMDRNRLQSWSESPDETILNTTDLVVTTYAMLKRFTWMAEMRWRLVILDEAQAIRNPRTRQSRTARQLPAGSRIALTGTPIENRLMDLWTIFDFLNPGLLGSQNRFKAFVKSMESRRSDQFAPLKRLIEPYILRRMKTDRRIIADLPEKTEVKRYCQMSKKQVALYEKTVRNLKNALAAVRGIERRGLVLQTILRLKQICNHPAQFLGDADFRSEFSGKFRVLTEICSELGERQEKALIFTQFREIIDPLADHLAGVFGREGVVLHGGTTVRNRKKRIDLFQADGGPSFFIISIKAGGTGLNLTAASHVIHFDRWWNPAVENQATDRAFRIGQKKNVIVHKFVTRGTIEEHIDRLIDEKKGLATEVLSSSGEINVTEMTDDELLNLVQLDVTRVEM